MARRKGIRKMMKRQLQKRMMVKILESFLVVIRRLNPANPKLPNLECQKAC